MTFLLAIVLVLFVSAFIVAPLLRQETGTFAESSTSGGELWTREKAVAVLAITEADFDRATGKLSDDDYRILRSDYEGRALQAMDEMDKLVSAVPEGTVRFCAGCGTRFSSTDLFCGCCGRPRLTA